MQAKICKLHEMVWKTINMSRIIKPHVLWESYVRLYEGNYYMIGCSINWDENQLHYAILNGGVVVVAVAAATIATVIVGMHT